MENNKKLRNIHIVTIIIGTIFVSLSVFHTNIWFDEAYSVGIADHSFGEIWRIGGGDVHPVLYYWMLHIIQIITNGSILAYRLFSVIPIILLGILGITHIKKDFDEETGFLFSFFTFFMPFVLVYANQIRMYSWAIYFVTLASIYGYRLYKGKTTTKNWIIFALFSLASLYIHYYGLMAAGLINLFLLLHFWKKKNWKEIRNTLFFGVLQLILYTPWLIYLLSQMHHVSSGFWIGFSFPTTLFELIGCQMNGVIPIWTGFVINILLFIILGILYSKNRKSEDFDATRKATIIYTCVILAALLITVVLKTSILYYRYLFVITGLYIFTVSNILSKSKSKILVIVVCTAVVVIGLINNIEQIKENYAVENGKQIEYLKNNIEPNDVLVYKNIGNGSIFASNFKENKQYYYNADNWDIDVAYQAWAPQMKIYNNTDFLKEITGRIWIIDSENDDMYNELFKNDEYRLISSERFDVKYQDYVFKLILVEKII